jgi:gamma-glutamylcyclotransferase (GGCT)/AIG2-like uncharacterized protein YtfP
MDHLFVYGTLRSPFPNPYARLLAERGTLVGRARIHGKLYDLGPYPGMLLSDAPEDWVIGELYRLHDPAQTLAILDDYEGPPYTRVTAPVRTELAEAIDAWVYIYNFPVTERQRVLSGDYLDRLGTAPAY